MGIVAMGTHEAVMLSCPRSVMRVEFSAQVVLLVVTAASEVRSYQEDQGEQHNSHQEVLAGAVGRGW